MHEPVVLRGYRGEGRPSHLPEFCPCNLSNVHLVPGKITSTETYVRYRKSERKTHVAVYFDLSLVPLCGELVPFPGYPGVAVPRSRCKQVWPV
jgi:hypothetical protein